jgi:hypothetical protein
MQLDDLLFRLSLGLTSSSISSFTGSSQSFMLVGVINPFTRFPGADPGVEDVDSDLTDCAGVGRDALDRRGGMLRFSTEVWLEQRS